MGSAPLDRKFALRGGGIEIIALMEGANVEIGSFAWML
jgi:hypothetical protein